MRTIGNLLWLIFGGFLLAVLWFIAGILCCITVVGIPAGVQCMKFAGFVLWPFGRTVIYGGRTGSLLLNILWILIFGWELAAASFLIGIALCVTIVGIPFGIQFLKFAKLAIMPFGAGIVAK
ncbi:MAG: YccF domain-containing protein [Eubacteriales bacterium]